MGKRKTVAETAPPITIRKLGALKKTPTAPPMAIASPTTKKPAIMPPMVAKSMRMFLRPYLAIATSKVTKRRKGRASRTFKMRWF